jgi:hypothetical protein
MGKAREAVRKKIVQNLNCEKWKKINPSHEQEERAAALRTKYGGKKLTDLRSQKTSRCPYCAFGFHCKVRKLSQSWHIHAMSIYVIHANSCQFMQHQICCLLK